MNITRKPIVAAILAGMLAGPALGQDAAQPPTTPAPLPTPPCTADENFRAFDFWVGDWEVTTWPGGGAIGGHNKISPVEGGCALEERWTNSQGGTGRSLNFYNPNTGKWRQLWVAGGYSIDIVGGLKDGAMALEGTIYYYRQNNSVPFKGTWTPQPDGSVRQFFEQYNAETKEWAVWFDGKYVRYTPEN